jgi:NADPH-dependent ferric siderophore reductase
MVANMRMFAPDQWIKLYIPNRDGTALRVEANQQYNKLPKDTRPPVRTYTISDLRADDCQFDVDVVLHGDEGPASRWAANAKAGDTLQIRAHCYSSQNTPAGCRWLPPETATKFLLFADETGLPAVRGILNLLAQSEVLPDVDLFVEIPTNDDCLTLPQLGGLNATYLVKTPKHSPGDQLIESAGNISATKIPDDVYIWVAAEKSATRSLVAFFTETHKVKKQSISQTAYWKREGSLT